MPAEDHDDWLLKLAVRGQGGRNESGRLPVAWPCLRQRAFDAVSGAREGSRDGNPLT
jgi:hypothetical protein